MTAIRVTVAAGQATIDGLVVRSPGPTGPSVGRGARVEAQGVVVSGTKEEPRGFLGDCVQVMRGALRLRSSVLAHSGGAAVESSGWNVELRGVDAAGGAAGCLVFVDRSRADLDGNRCSRRGRRWYRRAAPR